MFEFLQLLEANMPVNQAVAIFKRMGATVDDLSSPERISIFRRTTMMRGAHEDKGGNHDDAALLNSAYDTIKNGAPKRIINVIYGIKDVADDDGIEDFDDSAFDPNFGKPPTREPTPIWAMAGHSGGAPPSANISRQNYTDINYIKKSMYFMSKDDPEQQVYHVDAFDGYFFRGALSTYASPSIFAELAQAMIMWNSHGGNPYATRAVFVQKRKNPTLYLIYADGKYYTDNPIPFEHDSMNMNASNDQQFVRRLPGMLDKLREGGSI